MLKLYRNANGRREYWEVWKDGGVYTVHWGELGTRGETREINASWLGSGKREVMREAEAQRAAGFAEIDGEQQVTLLVEYAVSGMGTGEDLDKRHELEDRLDETLGWTSLGHCDGGSIGSGTMEVCCFVVDFGLAKKVIADDLRGTEFGNYTRIYNEDADDDA